MAEIDLDIREVQDKKRDIAFWANASHGGPSRRDDGAGAVKASSTSRVWPPLGLWTFIGAYYNRTKRRGHLQIAGLFVMPRRPIRVSRCRCGRISREVANWYR